MEHEAQIMMEDKGEGQGTTQERGVSRSFGAFGILWRRCNKEVLKKRIEVTCDSNEC